MGEALRTEATVTYYWIPSILVNHPTEAPKQT